MHTSNAICMEILEKFENLNCAFTIQYNTDRQRILYSYHKMNTGSRNKKKFFFWVAAVYMIPIFVCMCVDELGTSSETYDDELRFSRLKIRLLY